ncbi:MFS transporter [Niallia circulans]|jgi:MFS transporter, OFA family, oxalate/formate antiporter|uniref:MFS transporter n=1 Tax=Niallia TaxID=2837506 RepID=UPI0011A3E9B0|nr:MFS transporter [Niallia circulans]NRG34406.1 MFS transporter [Niallia circulans]
MKTKTFANPWIIFIGCCLMSFVGFGLVVNTHGLYFAPLTEELGLNKTELSLTLTLQAIACAVTLIFSGRIMSKVNTQLLLTLCILMFGGGFILFAFFTSIVPFLIVWTLIGIAQAFALVVAIPVLLGNWFEKKLGLVMGVALGVSGLGGAFFNPMISSIIINNGWRTATIVSGILILVCILPFTLFVFRSAPNAEKGELPYGRERNTLDNKKVVEEVVLGITAKEAYRTSSFYFYLITMFSLSMVGGIVQHVSGHIVNEGFNLTVGASVVSAIMLGAAAGKFLIGILLDIFHANLVISLYAIFGIVGWGGLIWFSSEVSLVGSGFLLGLGQGISLVAIPYFVRKTFGAKEYSQIYSIIAMVGSFASAISATLGGVFFDKLGSYHLPISTNLVFYLIAALCILTAYAHKKKINSDTNEIREEKLV